MGRTETRKRKNGEAKLESATAIASSPRSHSEEGERKREGGGDEKRVKMSEPAVVCYQDITAASYRIRKGVKETPLEVWRIIMINTRLSMV